MYSRISCHRTIDLFFHVANNDNNVFFYVLFLKMEYIAHYEVKKEEVKTWSK